MYIDIKILKMIVQYRKGALVYCEDIRTFILTEIHNFATKKR